MVVLAAWSRDIRVYQLDKRDKAFRYCVFVHETMMWKPYFAKTPNIRFNFKAMILTVTKIILHTDCIDEVNMTSIKLENRHLKLKPLTFDL